jgi:hypothetical protein
VCLRAPHAVVGESICEVTEGNFRAEFRSQSSEAIGAATRTDAAGDSDDDERVMGEAIPVVHVAWFVFCSVLVKPSSAADVPAWLPDHAGRYA